MKAIDKKTIKMYEGRIGAWTLMKKYCDERIAEDERIIQELKKTR